LVGFHGVGIILSIESDSINILDSNNQQKNVALLSYDSKVNTINNVAKNLNGSDISSGSTIKIAEGHYKNNQALVKHVYKDIVFLFSPDFQKNTQGIIVEKVNNCILISAKP